MRGDIYDAVSEFRQKEKDMTDSSRIQTISKELYQCTFCLAPLFEKKDSHSVKRLNCRNYRCPLYKIAIGKRMIEDRMRIQDETKANPSKEVEDD